MPPKAKKNEHKESKGNKEPKDSNRERTDEELKASPTFKEQFYREVLKHANPEEKKVIETSHQNSKDFDEFTLGLFDVVWFLEKYEDLFSATKETMKTLAKKEEPPVKLEPKLEEYIPPNFMKNPSEYPPYYQPYPTPTGPIYNQMMMPNMDAYSYQQSPYPISQSQPLSQLQPAYNQPGSMMPGQMASQKPGHMPAPMQGQMPGTMMNQMPGQMPTTMGTHTPVQMPPQISPHTQHPIQPQPTQATLPGVNRGVSEKEDRTTLPLKDQYQTTTEFETNAQLRQKMNTIVPLNCNLMISNMNKQNKKATDGFYQGLYLSIADYVRNLLDELKNICEMDLDATDLKNYMKTGGSNELEGENKTVLMGGMEIEQESKALKPHQYLVKFSSIQEDQKQLEKLDDREQKDLEDKYTLSKDDDEEKITKKVKKDFTEEDEIIKFLFKTKKDKGQDNENLTKRLYETNLTISTLTSRTTAQPKTTHMQDSMLQREASGKGRKTTAFQKRVTMKHLIYYLEMNPLYKRTPLLHKAYLK